MEFLYQIESQFNSANKITRHKANSAFLQFRLKKVGNLQKKKKKLTPLLLKRNKIKFSVKIAPYLSKKKRIESAARLIRNKFKRH